MLLLFSVYAVGCLFFLGVIRGQRPFIVHPDPLPSREREKERGVEGGNEFREKERKETIRGNSFPLILVDVFPPVVFCVFIYVLILRRRLPAFSLGVFFSVMLLLFSVYAVGCLLFLPQWFCL